MTSSSGRRLGTSWRSADHRRDVRAVASLARVRRSGCQLAPRYTGLTWMADAGVPVHVLRKIAGHGSLTTTQRYLHPDATSIAAAGESLTAYLRAPRSRGARCCKEA